MLHSASHQRRFADGEAVSVQPGTREAVKTCAPANDRVCFFTSRLTTLGANPAASMFPATSAWNIDPIALPHDLDADRHQRSPA